MIRRIAGAVNDALSGIEEFVVIQVKSPSPTGDQKKSRLDRWGRAFALQPCIARGG